MATRYVTLKDSNGDTLYPQAVATDINPIAITPSDYISFNQDITINTLAGYKIGKLVNIQYDIQTSLVAGQNVVGTATNKVLKTTYGSGRVTNWNNNTQGVASIVVIPNGAVRIYTSQVGTASAGDVWFFEA